MSNGRTIGVIRPESVAHKLAAIRNYEHPKLLEEITAKPRLVQVLLFLQYMSMQPGGLQKLCEDMIDLLPQRFGTPTMREEAGENYSLATKVAVWSEIPDRYRPPDAPENGGEWLARELLDSSDEEPIAKDDDHIVAAYLKTFKAVDFQLICLRAAREMLPGYLAAVCEQVDKDFTAQDWLGEIWFMADPVATVIEMMDCRAKEVSRRLAMTVVASKVFDALDYAREEKVMTRVEGNARFGKSESVGAYCERWAGLVRAVRVPSSNSLADLLQRIAEALGMDVSYGSRKQGIKERVEFVLKHTGIFLVLDEAAFLVPQSYTRTTAPARLNWVRTEIVDRGLPLALVVTPDGFLPMVDRFIKKTGYTMEQFFGRTHRVVQLPKELDEQDMMAVARIHFPEMEDDCLAQIADLARMSENYLQAVEAIAKLARYIARRENHRRVTVADLQAAADEVVPPMPAGSAEAGSGAGGGTTAPARHSSSRDSTRSLRGVSRALKPARSDQEAPSDLPSRSLRGAGPERVETELVPVET